MGYITDENDNLVYIETGGKKKETQSDFPNLDELIEVHQKEVQRIEKKIAETLAINNVRFIYKG